MNLSIITQSLNLELHGFSGTVLNKDYSGTAFKLMDKMWQEVKSKGLKHKGLNIWVYEPNEKVFVGVELEEVNMTETSLELKSISLEKYAYFKHIGPYQLIKQVGQAMRDELKNRGFEVDLPYLEIYGHWTADESKLETEMLMCLK